VTSYLAPAPSGHPQSSRAFPQLPAPQRPNEVPPTATVSLLCRWQQTTTALASPLAAKVRPSFPSPFFASCVRHLGSPSFAYGTRGVCDILHLVHPT
jgi:hypothetical protein